MVLYDIRETNHIELIKLNKIFFVLRVVTQNSSKLYLTSTSCSWIMILTLIPRKIIIWKNVCHVFVCAMTSTNFCHGWQCIHYSNYVCFHFNFRLGAYKINWLLVKQTTMFMHINFHVETFWTLRDMTNKLYFCSLHFF